MADYEATWVDAQQAEEAANKKARVRKSVLGHIAAECIGDLVRMRAIHALPELYTKFGDEGSVRATAEAYIAAKAPTYYDDNSAVTVDELSAALAAEIDDNAKTMILTVGFFGDERAKQASKHLSLTAHWRSYAADPTAAINAEVARGVTFPHEIPEPEEVIESPFLDSLRKQSR